MTEKKSQNKYPNILWDYFKTNRNIDKEQREKGKHDDASKSREKAMVIVLVLAIVVLIVKSTVLDEVKDLNPEEQIFKEFVEYSVEEEYSGFLVNKGIIKYRIYDLYMADADQEAVLRYKDPDTNQMVDVVQEGRYNARVRGYLFWILPVKHFSVTAQIIE